MEREIKEWNEKLDRKEKKAVKFISVECDT